MAYVWHHTCQCLSHAHMCACVLKCGLLEWCLRQAQGGRRRYMPALDNVISINETVEKNMKS